MSNDSGKGQSSSSDSSQVELSQKSETLSPYFIAQSIALPGARSIPSKSSTKTKKRSKSKHTSNICSSVSTNSFSDASLYDHHISNTMSEERLPSSFRSKCLNSQNLSNSNDISCKPITMSNKTTTQIQKEYHRNAEHVVIGSSYTTSNGQSNDNNEKQDSSSHSISTEYNYQKDLAETNAGKCKNSDSHEKSPQHSNTHKRSSMPTSGKSFWDQKVKRMYL